jgi:MYXO-CTERM domain-containing protein
MMWWARVAVVGIVTFWSFTAGAAIAVNITKPTAGTAIGDSLPVAATITSAYQLASVQAQVGALTVPLPISASTAGTLDLTSVPTGSTTLTITATDMQGNSGSAQVVFRHDHAPSLAIAAPLPGTVARPSLPVEATCTDTDAYGCATIDVRLGSATGTVLATVNASAMNQTIALDTYSGQQINLYVVATDAAGMTSVSSALPIYVDTSPRLVEVQSVPAPIVDVDSTRILYGTTIRTRGTTDDVALPAAVGNTCRLSPSGALCNAGEWKNGAVVATWTTSNPANPPVFAARGNYAIWGAPDSAGGNGAYYRDSTAGTTTELANLGYGPVFAEDVAVNGDAVFVIQNTTEDGYPVYLYRGGTFTALTSTTTNAKYQNALTDGINVIYEQRYIGIGGGGAYLLTSGGTVTLRADRELGCSLFGQPHALSGGWAAYARPDSGCQTQIWTRAPDDTRTQLSVWSTSSTVDALNDAGQVMMLNTSSLGAYRYLASPGVFPDAVSSTLGRAIWLDGQWYIVMGRTLYSIAPASAGTDGGAPDLAASPPDLSMSPLDLSMSATVDLSVSPADQSAQPADMGAVAPMDASAGSPGDASGSVDLGSTTGGMHSGGCAMAPDGQLSGSAMVLGLLLLAAAVRRRRDRGAPC